MSSSPCEGLSNDNKGVGTPFQPWQRRCIHGQTLGASGLVTFDGTPYGCSVVWPFRDPGFLRSFLNRFRGGGLCFLFLILRSTVCGENIRFPADAGVIDVTKAPYFAKGDGRTDDTAALQQALLEHPNQNRIIYLPNGTYLVSAPLRWPAGTNAETSQRATILQGQSRAGTVIRLADHSPGYATSSRDAMVLWMGDSLSWRDRNAVRNLTIHTGEGNTLATGIALMANRQGCIRDVTVISGGKQGEGVAGIDAAHCDAIGPALIKNVRVEGFDFGIKAGHPQFSLTMEHVEVVGQRIAGIRNAGQTLSIRDLRSTNSVPGLLSRDSTGFVTLLDSTLQGLPVRRQAAAIQNQGFLFARRLEVLGYTNTIENRTVTNLTVQAEDITQFSSHTRLSQFPSPAEPLDLPIEETPEAPWDPLEQWVSPLKFGGLPNDDVDDGSAIQQAIDSGATTVYLPNGAWKITSPVEIRGAVRRIIGCEARIINTGLGLRAAFRFVEGKEPVVWMERLAAHSGLEGLIEHASSRRLVISSCSDVRYVGTGSGDLFLEDVSSRAEWKLKQQKVWARQWCIERDGSKVVNQGGSLWVLGLKSERGGTVVTTTEAGKTEVYGALIMAGSGPKSDPMFVIREASANLSFGEIAFQGSPFRSIVSESRKGVTRLIERGAPHLTDLLPEHGGGVAVPFYSGYEGREALPPTIVNTATNRVSMPGYRPARP
jgi:hypothetical protein